MVLSDDEPSTAGETEASELMARLGVNRAQLIDVAYVDLLRARAGPAPESAS